MPRNVPLQHRANEPSQVPRQDGRNHAGRNCAVHLLPGQVCRPESARTALHGAPSAGNEMQAGAWLCVPDLSGKCRRCSWFWDIVCLNKKKLYTSAVPQDRCNTSTLLASHMQRTHVVMDLPYRCGCCSHASSSLRHTINHFYTAHAKSGMLQCPFCLQVLNVRAVRGYNNSLYDVLFLFRGSGVRCGGQHRQNAGAQHSRVPGAHEEPRQSLVELYALCVDVCEQR